MEAINFTYTFPTNGATYHITNCEIDLSATLAIQRRLKAEGYRITTSRGFTYIIAFDQKDNIVASPLGKRVYLNLMKVYQGSK